MGGGGNYGMKIYMSRDFIYIFKSKTSFLILSGFQLYHYYFQAIGIII